MTKEKERKRKERKVTLSYLLPLPFVALHLTNKNPFLIILSLIHHLSLNPTLLHFLTLSLQTSTKTITKAYSSVVLYFISTNLKVCFFNLFVFQLLLKLCFCVCFCLILGCFWWVWGKIFCWSTYVNQSFNLLIIFFLFHLKLFLVGFEKNI